MSELGSLFAGLVTDGSLVVAVAVAALVGLISFASPCVLPLVPGYLGYVAGLSGSQAARPGVPATAGATLQTRGGAGVAALGHDEPGPDAPQGGRGRVLAGAVLFVAGFTVVFMSFGAAFGGLGRLLLEWAPVITRVMGVVTIVMGLAFLGGLGWLQRERRLHRRPPAGLLGAPLLGMVFGLGWTPCLGPTLSAVNALAYSEASATRGAILALAYCLGLGLPFVFIASGARRALTLSRYARRHARTVTRIGGGLLVLLGILLVTGTWDAIMIYTRAWLATTGLGSSFV
ncbi:cytochrome c biogenesis CcdA family protein [Modestobacter sp. Leaf380]|uniref:cytochrome c biogenesis CcdA family protein n=1 Tax=Modestobacter sp. Leaf380 TaxID=1736356 RepID=UPI0006FAD5D1|nr:cytochrome c biogenesis protein CcdA [Modestobacter sp. Leaf380]KQS64307.1 cytochrome C biogenesis protein ResC [Modestobacter sp. Leaf380]